MSQVSNHFCLYPLILFGQISDKSTTCLLRELFLSIHEAEIPLRYQMAHAGAKPFLSYVMYFVTWAQNSATGAQSLKDLTTNNFFSLCLFFLYLHRLGNPVHGISKGNRHHNNIS